MFRSATQANNGKLGVKTFSILLHAFSFMLLVICVSCIAVLFRDLRRLEELVNEKTSDRVSVENADEKARTKRADEEFQRLINDGSIFNFGSTKWTIITKDDERFLLQTSDGSSSVVFPSITKISLSTLEDFCVSTQQYCANKNPRSGGQRDLDSQISLPAEDADPSQTQHQSQRAVSATGPSSGSIELNANHIYEHDQSTSPAFPPDVQIMPPKRPKGLGRKKRKREKCYINQISDAVLMGQRHTFYGSWMQDASPREDFDADKRWVTEHFSGKFLHEYASAGDLIESGTKDTAVSAFYELPEMYDGTNHLIYNGSFIFQRAGMPIIVRYDLRTKIITSQTRIPGAAYRGGEYLYGKESGSYFDLAADENGIWAFFHYEKIRILSVARLHPKTMRLIRVQNLTRFDHTKIGDTWVTCGVMYVLASTTQWKTRVTVAYDLFRHRSATVNIGWWYNEYNKTTMLSYNPFVKKLHIYDNGHLLERDLSIACPGKPDGICPALSRS